MSENLNKIIGASWAFPPKFDKKSNSVVMVTGRENIQQSLSVLFGTERGERLLEQKYGCNITSFLFRPITSPTASIIKNQISRAVALYEPRIKLEKISIDSTQAIDGKLSFELDWLEETTNTRNNMVFPYYAIEGTLLGEKE